MESIQQQFFGILIAPPGNLIYHLTLAFSVFASLQVALINRRSSMISSSRALLGLNVLLVAQLALFLSSGLAWQGVINPHIFLPVFDRAVILFSLVWICWLWVFPYPSRAADIFTGLLNLGVIILFLFTYSMWNREGSGVAFNGTWQDWTWSVACLGIILVAIALVLFRRPEAWAIGLGMMALLLIGVLAHLFLPSGSADFSGYLRVAQLAAYPLIPGLLLRRPIQQSSAPPARTQIAHEASSGRAVDLRAVHAWMELNLHTDPEKINAGAARAVAQTMMADLCFVVSTPTDGLSPVALQVGYDLVKEEEINGTQLEQSRIPAIANALVRGKPLRILATETNPPDLKAVSEALGLESSGNILVIPLLVNNAPWGGLLLLTPYSQRVWSPDDLTYLSSETEIITEVLRRSQMRSTEKAEFSRLKDQLAPLQQEIAGLRQENQKLGMDLASLRQAAADRPAAIPADLESLLALQRESQDVIANLQIENTRLKTEFQLAVPDPSAMREFTQIEKELRITLEEVAHLQNLLANANIRSLELERKVGQNSSNAPEDSEVIASIVQELRQPMSSVMGYTDLLLAESVGILGALQRKFLERVRAATERLRGLMDDLIQVTAMSSGPLELVHQPIDLAFVIDSAIDEVSARLREKEINMRVELPDRLPLLHADHEAIRQIVGHLLENAILVTPTEGTIYLRTGLYNEEKQDFLLLQVTDEGGGIQAQDLPAVFERRYRADNVLIQGIGDAGVGLSITKTLVEALNGRVWVDCKAGQTSTFSVLLPTQASTNGEVVAE